MHMCYKIFTPLGYWVLLAKKQRLGPKFEGGWARAASKTFGTPYIFLQPLKLATSNLVHNLVLGLAYQKTTFLPKLAGLWAKGASEKKIGTPYVFLQPLKLAALNLVHNLGVGLAYQKTTFWTEIGGVCAKGASKLNLGPPYVFLQPLKLTTSNVVHKLGLGLA